MFTGLIEAIGVVSAVEPAPSGFRLRVRTDLASELTPGDSVAVNGCCLTVIRCAAGEMYADLGPETARLTTLGSLLPERRVNLERSLRADGRFGGHFVQGHVDGIGGLEAVWPDGDSHWIRVTVPPALATGVVQKGSIALDGISLTVARLERERLDVMIVPFTWQHTNLSLLQPGDLLNVECDMIGKYVARAMEAYAGRLKAAPTM